MTTTHWPTAIAASSFLRADIVANTTNTSWGVSPSAGFNSLQGTVEHIHVYANTSIKPAIDVVFLNKVNTSRTHMGTTAQTDSFIDYESIAVGDFIGPGTKPLHAAKSGIKVPYIDKDKTRTFHIGILNTKSSTAIAAKTLTLEWAWRPSIGRD